METEEIYLRKLLHNPAMLNQYARREARAGDGMQRLRWAATDTLQIGILSSIALTPSVPSDSLHNNLFMATLICLVATLLAAFVRRAFMSNFFAMETANSQLRRAIAGAVLTFLAVGSFSLPMLPSPGQHLLRIIVCAATSTVLSVILTLVHARWSGSVQTAVGNSAVAVIGSQNAVSDVIDALQSGRWPGWTAAMRLNDAHPEDVEQLRLAVAGGEIDVVIISTAGAADRVRHIVAALPDATARVCVALDVPNGQGNTNTIWLVDLWRNPHDGVPGAIKRVIDLLLSTAGLVVLSPALALVALAIKFESPGPVIFRQWRFGACSRPFQVLKFRTMRYDASDLSGAKRTLAVDPRVTRVGRLLRRASIDELPQLLNVLAGEMSLVGPRAQAMFMEVNGQLLFEALGDYPARHRVLPGITGWAQVNGSRGEVDTIEKAERRTSLDLGTSKTGRCGSISASSCAPPSAGSPISTRIDVR